MLRVTWAFMRRSCGVEPTRDDQVTDDDDDIKRDAAYPLPTREGCRESIQIPESHFLRRCGFSSANISACIPANILKPIPNVSPPFVFSSIVYSWQVPQDTHTGISLALLLSSANKGRKILRMLQHWPIKTLALPFSDVTKAYWQTKAEQWHWAIWGTFEPF